MSSSLLVPWSRSPLPHPVLVTLHVTFLSCWSRSPDPVFSIRILAWLRPSIILIPDRPPLSLALEPPRTLDTLPDLDGIPQAPTWRIAQPLIDNKPPAPWTHILILPHFPEPWPPIPTQTRQVRHLQPPHTIRPHQRF